MEEIYEIMAWKFSKIDAKTETQEARKTPRKINTKKSTSRYILLKLEKAKDKKFWKKPEGEETSYP